MRLKKPYLDMENAKLLSSALILLQKVDPEFLKLVDAEVFFDRNLDLDTGFKTYEEMMRKADGTDDND